MRFIGSILITATLFVLIMLMVSASSAYADSLLISHVNLIPMTNPDVVDDIDVFIDDGVIVSIEPGGFRDPTSADRVIEGRGLFLMPGLIDMHTRLASIPEPTYLALFARYGVTTVRSLHGDERSLEWRERAAAGTLLSPRIITSGPLIDSQSSSIEGRQVVTTEEQIRAAVAAQAEAGFDLISIGNRQLIEIFRAGIQEAAHREMPIAAHAPWNYPLEELLETPSVVSVERMGGLQHMIESRRSIYAKSWHWSKDFYSFSIDPDRLRKNIPPIAELSPWLCPAITLVRSFEAKPDIPGKLEAIELEEMPKALLESWHPNAWTPERERRIGWRNSNDAADVKRGARQMMLVIGWLRSGGATLLAGTGAPSMLVGPGASLADEVAFFVDEGGLEPFDALATATTNPARFLGLEDQIGTIETGKQADLVLLESNPLEDVLAIRQVRATVLNGVAYDVDELRDAIAPLWD